MKINLELIKSFNPCKEGLENYILYHESFEGTPLEFLRLDNLPVNDKFWMIFREEFIPEKDLHLLACQFAEDVLYLFEREHPNDQRPRLAIQAKRDFANGKISKEDLARAASAAASAAWAAAREAASAAWAAAREAAREATWEAARAAAREAARENQLNHVIKYFEGK